MIPRIGVEGYKYGKCLAQSWLEPIRRRGMGKGRVNHGSPSYTCLKKGGSHQDLNSHLHPFRENGPWHTKTASALHHLFLYQDPLLSHPLIGSSQLWAKHIPYLYPSTPTLGITFMLNAYEDGTASKFWNVGTKRSDARRLPKRHNTRSTYISTLDYVISY